MTAYQYCTPQWLKKSFDLYQDNQEAKDKLKKLTVKMGYRVKAEPSWGIDKDVYFWVCFEAGEMTCLELISEQEIKNQAEYLLTATPETWKKILKNEKKFITDFMLGNIKLEQGSKIGVLSVAPHANNVVAALTPFDLVFPDELSKDDLEVYRANMETFRQELGV